MKTAPRIVPPVAALVAAAALALALLPAEPARADSLRNVKQGQTVPDFEMTTLTGETVRSADFKGRALIMVFVSAHQHSSELAAAAAHEVAQALHGEKLALLYVTSDVAETTYFRGERDRNNIHEPLGLDFDRAAYGAFGLIVHPTTVVIDPSWRLAHVISAYTPDYPQVLSSYARHALGKLDDAALEKELKSQHFDRDRPADRIARRRSAAAILRQNGLFADAEKELRAALEIDAQDVDTRLDLASLLIAMEQVDDARTIIDAVLAAQPRHRRATLLLGIALYQAGDLTAAQPVLEQALLLNPDPALTHYYLGLIHEHNGDQEQALNHYKEALGRLLKDRAP